MIKQNRLYFLLGGVIVIGICGLIGLIAVLFYMRGGSNEIAAVFATATPTFTPTATYTPSATPTPTVTPTSTDPPTATATITNTPLPTSTPTATLPPSHTPQFTFTPRPTFTPIVSNTPVPPAITNTPTTLVEVGTNMLANPSFEEGSSVFANDGDLRVPNNWMPWWNHSQSGCNNNKPHFEIEMHPPHVINGSSAARYYTGYSTHTGGLMQQVSVTPGQTYRFTVYGFAWSTDNPVVDSPSNSSAAMWAGIDPSAGLDGQSGSVVWSSGTTQMDSYVLFTVDVKATAGQLTVFTRTKSDYCVARNDSFWDNASLVRLATAP